MNPPRRLAGKPPSAILILAFGVALISVVAVVTYLSPQFYYGGNPLERPTRLVVALLMTAGGVYLAAVYLVCKAAYSRALLLGVLGIGVVLRALLFNSTPILEDDYYRYLWDGAVTANGFNPYAHAPIDAMRDSTAPEALRELATTGPIQRVNHPELGTIYPPVAQAVFAVAHWIAPWSLGAWRGVLLLFDAATLGIVLLTLKAIGRPLHWAAMYWWNPVLPIEIVNSAHMDAVALPIAAGAFYCGVRAMPLRSALLLALGAAVKVWPLILLPLMLRGQGISRARSIGIAAACVILAGLLYIPVFAAREPGVGSGFLAYGERWEMNDALFLVALKTTEFAVQPFAFENAQRAAGLGARVLVAAALAAVIVGLTMRAPKDGVDRANRVVLAIGAMFMLSPTQFPWYYTWLVPFLALKPRASFMVLSMMLPMYYLTFYYDARGNVDFFHNLLVWVEYAPVFALFIYEIVAARRARLAVAHA